MVNLELRQLQRPDESNSWHPGSRGLDRLHCVCCPLPIRILLPRGFSAARDVISSKSRYSVDGVRSVLIFLSDGWSDNSTSISTVKGINHQMRSQYSTEIIALGLVEVSHLFLSISSSTGPVRPVPDERSHRLRSQRCLRPVAVYRLTRTSPILTTVQMCPCWVF